MSTRITDKTYLKKLLPVHPKIALGISKRKKRMTIATRFALLKKGNNDCQVKSFADVAYGKGVAMCDGWNSLEKFIFQNYRNFVRKYFPRTL